VRINARQLREIGIRTLCQKHLVTNGVESASRSKVRQSGNYQYKTGFSAKIEHAYSHQVVNEYGEGSRPGKAQEAS
jgi:hypothetical protein